MVYRLQTHLDSYPAQGYDEGAMGNIAGRKIESGVISRHK